MKNVKKLIMLFVFICIFMFSVPNVSALNVVDGLVEVQTAEDFKKYIQRQDTEEETVTEIKLGADILLENAGDFAIIVEDGLTIDLNGYTITFNDGQGAGMIAYGLKAREFTNCNNGTLIIKDSSEEKTGKIDKIISFLIMNMSNEVSTNTDEQSYKLVLDGGNYIKTETISSTYATFDSLFYLTEANNEAWHDNVKFTFEVNDSNFEIKENNELATGALFVTVIDSDEPNTNPDLDINFNFKKLTLKSKNGQLVKNGSYNLEYKVDDIIPNTSKLYIGNTTLNKEMEITDRTTSVVGSLPTSVYSNLMESYEYMKVEEVKYNLTTSVNGTGGTISDSISNILPNTKKTITFTPNTGFMIDKVLVNNVETEVTNNQLELTMNEDKNVVVTYKKIPFTITTSVNGSGGTISDSISDILPNTKKIITFTPNTGFMIDKVLVNNVETEVTNNQLELTMNEDKNVVVTYKKIPFTITVKETDNTTITPNGVINVNYGDNQYFVINASYGYKIVKVLVDGQNQELDANKLTVSNITKDLEVEVFVEQIVYNFLEGTSQTYTVSKDKELRFRIDADYSLFNNLVYVDGELVDPENYTSESGSTIVILKQNYLDILQVGKHIFKVKFSDGAEVETEFAVAQLEIPEENPKTFDDIGISLLIGTISLIGLIGVTIYLKKSKLKM